ncbi:MAG: TlpA family protein disulfide reductase [Candidatus Thiodiazotropha sp. (ex Myrtea sp. 'scaly one' KF741663)]|nr:TlpA family protein disulfide reductase [Candidatus Thiodiazotropha sp. (ex Myrtea sp. 'scaly one' KF741663)]
MIGKPIIFILLILFSTAAVSTGLGLRSYNDPKLATDFSLSDLAGQLHQRSDYANKPYIVSFWATWCVPCIKEMPYLQRAAELLNKDGITVLTVNSGEVREKIDSFLKRRPIKLPILLDERAVMIEQWRVLALPTSYLVNADGLVVARVVGGLDWDKPSVLTQVRTLILTPHSE